MARRSARIASSQQNSSPSASQSSPASANKKRKAESGASPSAKRGKKSDERQQTIEDSMEIDKGEPAQLKPEDQKEEAQTELKDQPAGEETHQNSEKEEIVESQPPEQANGHTDAGKPEVQEKEEGKPKQDEPKAEREVNNKRESENSVQEHKSSASEQPKSVANGDGAVEPDARDGNVPSSILEKGIMYLLYRGRVNIESPDSVQDLARSYLILRPLPHGAKLSDGPIGDEKKCRLIAIPKKVLPLSGKDRWTAFVEKSNVSIAELKESFLKSDQYETQQGTREVPPATPAAEAVYAITTTGRESHLAYITTLPQDLGQIQNDLGLRQKGSFILSTKNPKAPGPANADIGKDPGYSQELQDEFRSLRWAPLKPAHLNYEGCQFLMVGEGEQGIEKATAPQDGDEKAEQTPKEELEKLQDEDEIRVEHLNGEDAVFEDLGTNAKDYPKLQTTW